MPFGHFFYLFSDGFDRFRIGYGQLHSGHRDQRHSAGSRGSGGAVVRKWRRDDPQRQRHGRPGTQHHVHGADDVKEPRLLHVHLHRIVDGQFYGVDQLVLLVLVLVLLLLLLAAFLFVERSAHAL